MEYLTENYRFLTYGGLWRGDPNGNLCILKTVYKDTSQPNLYFKKTNIEHISDNNKLNTLLIQK